MTELAEGARLEIVCSAKSGTEGSNPSLSARKFAERKFYILLVTINNLTQRLELIVKGYQLKVFCPRQNL